MEIIKEEVYKCSKCGLCQAECPIYQLTGNDCTVSRGLFLMLKGYLKNELKMSKTINRYLDICLKCNACSKFCPSSINIVDVIIAGKHEYFKTHPFEKIKTLLKIHKVENKIIHISKDFAAVRVRKSVESADESATLR